MTDPERIIRGPKGALETQLLSAVRREVPPTHGRARVLALLGISAGSVALVTGTANAAVTAASVSAKATSATSLVFTGKWVVVSIAAAALTVGVAYEIVPSVGLQSPASSASPASAHAESRANSVENPGSTGMDTPTESLNGAPSIARAMRGVETGSGRNLADSTADEKSRNPSNLADEVAALDKARAASMAGNPARALKLLDVYQRQFPNGTLGPEAQLLRIEALTRNGQSAIARPLARQMLQAAPTGPHAERIRALLPAEK